YLLYFFSSNGSYTVFSQENLIQQSNGLSIIAAVSSDIHNSEISKKYAKLLISEGFFGLIMIEVKLYNEKFYMIEANPRLWGPSQLILDSKMDLFHNFAIENGLLDSFHASEYLQGVNYLWTGGIIQDQIEKKNVAFHNYSPKHFFENYHKWILSDILNRDDTKQIYESELN
ncbi:MAG: hypothetical protein KDC52_14130, partial [Ignavibacteriae bacterium]|nr:hypothetical protein [Ignavibacteriota bacterium]